jgi:hypothetical protein
MMTTIRWPLRYGCTALVTVDGEPDVAPAPVDDRQTHVFGCCCARCLDLIARQPAVDAVREDCQ